MLALVVVEGVAIVLLGLLVAGLLRSHAEILQSLHELGAGVYPDADTGRRGAPTPVRIGAHRPADAAVFDLAGTTLADDVAALAIAGSPQRTLLAFLSSGCATCARFWEAFGDPGLTVPGGARLVIVTKDATEESEARLRELSPADEMLVLSSAAWQDYRVPAARTSCTSMGPPAGWSAKVRPSPGHRWPRSCSRRSTTPGCPARGSTVGPGGRSWVTRTGRPAPSASCSRPASPRATRACTPLLTALAGTTDIVPTVVVLVGLPLATVAAIRSTWSP